MVLPPPRILFACTIPTIIVILSFIWFKRKRELEHSKCCRTIPTVNENGGTAIDEPPHKIAEKQKNQAHSKEVEGTEPAVEDVGGGAADQECSSENESEKNVEIGAFQVHASNNIELKKPVLTPGALEACTEVEPVFKDIDNGVNDSDLFDVGLETSACSHDETGNTGNHKSEQDVMKTTSEVLFDAHENSAAIKLLGMTYTVESNGSVLVTNELGTQDNADDSLEVVEVRVITQETVEPELEGIEEKKELQEDLKASSLKAEIQNCLPSDRDKSSFRSGETDEDSVDVRGPAPVTLEGPPVQLGIISASDLHDGNEMFNAPSESTDFLCDSTTSGEMFDSTQLTECDSLTDVLGSVTGFIESNAKPDNNENVESPEAVHKSTSANHDLKLDPNMYLNSTSEVGTDVRVSFTQFGNVTISLAESSAETNHFQVDEDVAESEIKLKEEQELNEVLNVGQNLSESTPFINVSMGLANCDSVINSSLMDVPVDDVLCTSTSATVEDRSVSWVEAFQEASEVMPAMASGDDEAESGGDKNLCSVIFAPKCPPVSIDSSGSATMQEFVEADQPFSTEDISHANAQNTNAVIRNNSTSDNTVGRDVSLLTSVGESGDDGTYSEIAQLDNNDHEATLTSTAAIPTIYNPTAVWQSNEEKHSDGQSGASPLSCEVIVPPCEAVSVLETSCEGPQSQVDAGGDIGSSDAICKLQQQLSAEGLDMEVPHVDSLQDENSVDSTVQAQESAEPDNVLAHGAPLVLAHGAPLEQANDDVQPRLSVTVTTCLDVDSDENRDSVRLVNDTTYVVSGSTSVDCTDLQDIAEQEEGSSCVEEEDGKVVMPVADSVACDCTYDELPVFSAMGADEPELHKFVNGGNLSAYGSASHSPAEDISESPTASNYSDLHSEGSSDSGKGGSDIHAPSAEGTSNKFLFTPLQVFEFELQQSLCGRLIGQRGRFVNSIKSRSNANICIKRHPINPDLKLCAVIGTEMDITSALVMIRKRFPVSKFPSVSLLQVNGPLLNSIPVPDTLQLHLPEEVTCDVILSSMVNAGDFFVQQPTHPTYPSLIRLNQFMLACYMNGMGAPELPAPVEAGIICAATTMGGWYRAQVVYVYPDSDECDVKFVDYGGYSREAISSLRQIRSDFMTLPFQATQCFLANVAPTDENVGWSVDASAFFEEMAHGQILQAQIVAYSEEGIPFVHLYRIEGVTTTFINKQLVSSGLAKWVEHQA